METTGMGQTSNASPACTVCGSRDVTLRYVRIPIVFSILVRTFRREYRGWLCRKHRIGKLMTNSLVTAAFGWLGIPFGLLMTPVALFQLARGGNEDQELNFQFLKNLGEERYLGGDYESARKCYEACLQYRDSEEVQTQLARLYGLGQGTFQASNPLVGFISFAVLPLAMFLLAITAGAIDYSIGWALGGMLKEWNLLTDILFWIPLLSILFLLLLLLRAWIGSAISKAQIENNLLASGLSFVASLLTILGVATGETAGSFIAYVFHGLEFSSASDLFFSLGALVSHGGLYYFERYWANGSTYSVVSIVILLVFAIFYLAVNLPGSMNEADYQKKLGTIRSGAYSSFGSKPNSALNSLLALTGLSGFVLLIVLGYLLFPQKGTLDSLESYEAIYDGQQYAEKQDYQNALIAYQKAVDLRPGLPTPYIHLGYFYYSTDDFEHAALAFQKALSLDADSIDAHEGLAWSYYQEQKNADAIREFNRVLEFDPDRLDIRVGLGWSYLNDAEYDASQKEFDQILLADATNAEAYLGKGMVAYYRGDLVGAQTAIEKSISFNPDLIDSHIMLGYVFLAHDNGNAAIQPLLDAVKIDPKSFEANLSLGRAYAWTGKMDEAVKYFQAAVDLQPDDVSGLLQMGFYNITMGEFPTALSYLERAIAADPSYADLHAYLALLYYQTERSDLVEAELQKATSSGSADPVTEYSIATVLSQMYRYHESERYYQAAIENSPAFLLADIYSGLAMAYSAQREFDLAQTAVGKALAADPLNATGLVAQASLYIDQEQLDQASAMMDQALELNPGDPNNQSILSYILFHQGEIDAAASAAEKAVAGNPHDSSAQTRLAFAYHALGKLDDASSAAQEAVRLDPTSSLPHYILGVCDMEQGKNAEAITEFEKFQEYYWERAYMQEYKDQAEKFLAQLKSMP